MLVKRLGEIIKTRRKELTKSKNEIKKSKKAY
jgi:hypothetical protein